MRRPWLGKPRGSEFQNHAGPGSFLLSGSPLSLRAEEFMRLKLELPFALGSYMFKYGMSMCRT